MLAINDHEACLVARAGGPGTGRFVARALLDPLTNGSRLVGIRLHLLRNATLTDFVFSCEGGLSLEIVRCHLEPDGRLRECEVLRVRAPAPPASLESGELTRLLLDEGNIRSVELIPGGISLTTTAGSVSVSN